MPISDHIGGFIRPGYDPFLVPNAPTIGTATSSDSVGSNALSITFTAPSDVGGGAITGYTAIARDSVSGFNSYSATGSSSPIVITGLSTGRTYTVIVSATNPYGPSGMSAASNSITATQFYGSLWGWGENSAGELGLGNLTDRSSATQVGSLTTWLGMAGGGYSSIVLKNDRTVWTTGKNDKGQLGVGDTTNRSSLVQVGALTTWASVEAGTGSAKFTLAIKTDGTLWTWGWNNNGQLGDNSTTDRSSPVQVGALTNWLSVSAGHYNTVALKTDGTVWTFGQNDKGQLADGTTSNRSSPVQVGALTDWLSVSAGYSHVLASKTDGTLWAWGFRAQGQIGNGAAAVDAGYSSPVQVGALTTWNKPAGGGYSSYASKTDGTMWAWGYNNKGNLGQGNETSTSSPVQIGALTNWGSKTTGAIYSFANLKTDGTIWACGRNTTGELGDGTATDRSSPVQMGAQSYWVNVARGRNWYFGIKN